MHASLIDPFRTVSGEDFCFLVKIGCSCNDGRFNKVCIPKNAAVDYPKMKTESGGTVYWFNLIIRISI